MSITIEEVVNKLGLKPFDKFQPKKLEGRLRAGHTTRMIVRAISYASSGNGGTIVSHSVTHANHLREMVL